jgi:hypothetical protein
MVSSAPRASDTPTDRANVPVATPFVLTAAEAQGREETRVYSAAASSSEHS